MLLHHVPPRLLRNPHIQSMLASLALRRNRLLRPANPLIAAARPCEIDTGEARLAGSLSLQTTQPRGMVGLVHGWEGSMDSTYVLSLGTLLYRAGFDVLRLNLRDHGDTHGLNEGIFHACRLDEVIAAVGHVHAEHRPAAPLFLGGFSLGGNIVLRAALRAPAHNVPLRHVFAVCPVINPRSALQILENGPFIYGHYFRRKWHASLRAKQASHPQVYDFRPVRRERSFFALTDYFVRRYTEFRDGWHYLDSYALTGDRLAGLPMPGTLIAAADDPILPASDLQNMRRPENLELLLTRHGGHCGFVGDWRGRVWIEPPILRRLIRASRPLPPTGHREQS